MWSTAFTILHVFACLFLIVVVLLQTGKGTDVNAVFGGSSQTIFGSTGAGNFLTKLTTATAAIFMATSLFLTWGNARQTTKSVFDDAPPSPTVTTPPASEQPPAASSGASGTASDKPAEAPAASETAPAATPPTSSATPAPSVALIPSTTSPQTPTQGTATATPPATTPSATEPAKTPAATPPTEQGNPK